MSQAVSLSSECACQEQGRAEQARAFVKPHYIPQKSVLMESVRAASIGAAMLPLFMVSAEMAISIVWDTVAGRKLPPAKEMARMAAFSTLCYGAIGGLVYGAIGALSAHQHNVNADNANRDALFHQVAGGGGIQR